MTTTKPRPAKKAPATPRKRAAVAKLDPAPAKPVSRRPRARVEKDTVESVDVSQLDRVQLYNLAKREVAAVKDWEKAGSKGERPATPAHDRLQDPATKAKKAAGAPRSTKYDATKDTLIERVKTARATGVSFPALADVLNAESFDGKTDWTGPKIYAFACRNGVGKLPLVKPAKAEPKKATK